MSISPSSPAAAANSEKKINFRKLTHWPSNPENLETEIFLLEVRVSEIELCTQLCQK